MVKKQIGSGFTFNQSDVMGGQMARVGYSDCDTPAYYNKFQVYDVPTPTQEVQDIQPVQTVQAGGRRKKKNKSKRSKKSMKKIKKSTKRSKKSKKSTKRK